MNTCDTCIHWKRSKSTRQSVSVVLGDCSSPNWLRGYSTEDEEFKPDSVTVENDEGWAFETGPKFGCVHHTAGESRGNV